jgi:hypothetical protein
VYPERKNKWFYHSDLPNYGAVEIALGVGGRGRELLISATCSLHFAKASAATLP